MKLIRTPITEDMHSAAVRVLHRATGVDRLPQRMLDAMLAVAPAVVESDAKPLDPARFVAVNTGALQMVRNVLRRDADEGKQARGEMLEELDRATKALPQPTLREPTDAMHRAAMVYLAEHGVSVTSQHVDGALRAALGFAK